MLCGGLAAPLGAAVVRGSLTVDPDLPAGTDGSRLLLYAPNPLEPGSSISHWDLTAKPNLLMEPSINDDLTLEVTPPKDLTLPLLKDLGW